MIANLSLKIMRLLPTVGEDVQIEIDPETGVNVMHPMGAFGTAPDMPDEISRSYLADSLGALKEDPSQ